MKHFVPFSKQIDHAMTVILILAAGYFVGVVIEAIVAGRIPGLSR